LAWPFSLEVKDFVPAIPSLGLGIFGKAPMAGRHNRRSDLDLTGDGKADELLVADGHVEPRRVFDTNST
jgi:hypothetical protein